MNEWYREHFGEHVDLYKITNIYLSRLGLVTYLAKDNAFSYFRWPTNDLTIWFRQFNTLMLHLKHFNYNKKNNLQINIWSLKGYVPANPQDFNLIDLLLSLSHSLV